MFEGKKSRLWSLWLFSCIAVGLAACSPYLAPPGPGLDPDLHPSAGLYNQAISADEAPGVEITRGNLVTGDGLALPWRCWTPEVGADRLILALHGFNDYSSAFEQPALFWAQRGIKTCAYDQRGFGRSPNTGLWAGADIMTGDLRTAISALREQHPALPLFLLGDSMGGAVILAASDGPQTLPADGVILAAPAVWARATMPWYQTTALWISVHTLPWAQVSGGGLKIQPSDNIEMLRELGRDPLVIKETRVDTVYGLVNLMDIALAAAPRLTLPALLLYGERDEIVPADPTFELWRNLPQGAQSRQVRALYQDGWHMLLRDLNAQVVLADVAQWTEDPTAPLPSGADTYAQQTLVGLDSNSQED
ncbi:MAG: lysophospholipase [Pseudomonadota bacterium]